MCSDDTAGALHSAPPFIATTQRTHAHTWFMKSAVNEMPNLVGVTASPRLRQRLAPLNC